MPHPLLIFSQSNYLIQTVDTIYILNDKQCRSRSVGFFRSQLIWICTVCKGSVYPGPAGQGLRYPNTMGQYSIKDAFCNLHASCFIQCSLITSGLANWDWLLIMANFIRALRQSVCLAAKLPNSGFPSSRNICSVIYTNIIWTTLSQKVSSNMRKINRFRFIQHLHKVLSGHLLSIALFHSVKLFCQWRLKALIRPRGCKTFFMLNSAEHEIFVYKS